MLQDEFRSQCSGLKQVGSDLRGSVGMKGMWISDHPASCIQITLGFHIAFGVVTVKRLRFPCWEQQGWGVVLRRQLLLWSLQFLRAMRSSATPLQVSSFPAGVPLPYRWALSLQVGPCPAGVFFCRCALSLQVCPFLTGGPLPYRWALAL